MRPTSSIMLQQNNNNNYPCLNGLDRTPEMLQKCSRTSLPFSRALELGLADLPLIRGLRAWALCSKNRLKAGGVLGGGQAPIGSPAGRGSSAACPRPADVYLSREWGRMAYGPPFGPDAGRAGIRALVTVASLKTSEGSGKTQTQCLFLQTEKGSCLYSAGKPVFGPGVGGWLKGKTGASGCRETPVRQRDQGPAPVAQSGANHAGARSGRRWRKSGNAARREKKGGSRDGERRWREEPAAETTPDERQEEQDNGGLEGERFLSPPARGTRKEKVEELQSPTRCRETPSGGCSHCGGDAQRRDSLTRSSSHCPNSHTRPQRKADEDETRIICGPGSSGSAVSSVSDLETYKFHPESHSNSGATEIMEAESGEEEEEEEEDTESQVLKARTSSSCQQVKNDFALRCDAWKNAINQEKTQEAMKSLDLDEKEEKLAQISTGVLVVSTCGEDVLVCHPPLCVRAELPHQHCSPEGSGRNLVPKGLLPSDGERGKDGLREREQAVAEYRPSGEEEPDMNALDRQERNPAAVQEDPEAGSSEPSRLLEGHESSRLRDDGEASTEATSGTGGAATAALRCSFIAEQQGEVTWDVREDDLREGTIEPREIPEKGGGDEGGDCALRGSEDNGVQKDGSKGNGALTGVLRLQLSAEESRIHEETPDASGLASGDQAGANAEISANVGHTAHTDPSTSLTPSRANPAPFLPPLESMTTELPLLEVEREQEGERVRLLLSGKGQEGRSSHRGELEEPSEEEEEEEEERGCAVASQKDGKKEDEEDEEDEFGIFMQAEGESVWSEALTMPASVPCGSSESVDLLDSCGAPDLGNGGLSRGPARWTAACEDGLFRSDSTWTAFTQDSPDKRQDAAGQWWSTCAVEESRNGAFTDANAEAVFAEAFPSLPSPPSSDPCDLDTVSTLAQILRGKGTHEKGLLDGFHDLNKIICQRFTRATGLSRGLLLQTLQLEQQQTESHAPTWAAHRRLSPGPPTARQHPHNAAAKRRLSCDHNRNIPA